MRTILVPVLVLATILVVPAAAQAPLVADAGPSKAATAGTAIALAGSAHGGTAPYAFAWSIAGDASRFSDPASATPTLSTTGLAAGDLLVSLVVTDSLGAAASDTVLLHVLSASKLLDVTDTVVAGAPDEILLGAPLDRKQYTFAVPAGVTQLRGTLDWGNGLNDLDFVLRNPSNQIASGSQGQTSAKPERVTVTSPVAGTWRAEMQPFLSGPETFRIVVEAPGTASPLPTVSANGPYYAYPLAGAKPLTASASGGAPPYSFVWDTDADGALDTPGATVEAALGVGSHTVRVRVTDARGFEVDATALVRVEDVDTVLRLRCGVVPGTTWSMEFSAQKGRCFMHAGHNTYYTGGAVHHLRSAFGNAFAVEQQFSPPTEDDLADIEHTPVLLEASVDGKAWKEVARAEYTFLDTSPLGLPTRQYTFYDVADENTPFRFLRIRAPLSAAQGLSGFLDGTYLNVFADVSGNGNVPTTQNGTLSLSCEADLMERMFATHPCWFGGIDRYDSPSFFHTYYLHEPRWVERLAGNVSILPWRTDDWFSGAPVTNATRAKVFLQTSFDGVTFATVATIDVPYGTPLAFDLPVDGHPARFVRLFPEYHARFDDPSPSADPLQHPKAFFTSSAVTITGSAS